MKIYMFQTSLPESLTIFKMTLSSGHIYLHFRLITWPAEDHKTSKWLNSIKPFEVQSLGYFHYLQNSDSSSTSASFFILPCTGWILWYKWRPSWQEEVSGKEGCWGLHCSHRFWKAQALRVILSGKSCRQNWGKLPCLPSLQRGFPWRGQIKTEKGLCTYRSDRLSTSTDQVLCVICPITFTLLMVLNSWECPICGSESTRTSEFNALTWDQKLLPETEGWFASTKSSRHRWRRRRGFFLLDPL